MQPDAAQCKDSQTGQTKEKDVNYYFLKDTDNPNGPNQNLTGYFEWGRGVVTTD